MKEIRKELNRVIAELLLSLFMSFNIFGAGIEVDPNVPQNVNVDRAPNGVPVINISTPTDKGTSVNSFKEFNVDQRGVEILNNTGVGRGYLSGIVNPNPNLRPGQEARTVVFKVTGANRSEIEGYISALSPRPINLFIANENGIYVNGGGFINVNRAALVTGKINIQDGDVVSFTTRDGKVIIGEKGLDISNVERVDIITRTQELTGKIVGQKDVNIILGQNEVNLAGIVTPIITSDNKPALALNGGALGSIYSNGQVNIISTEKGVGVNLKSSVLSENDIRMKINGNADVKEIISKNAEIQTEDLKTDKINANNLSIRAKDYENRNEITAQNVNISSSNLKNNELTAGNLTLNTGNTESNRISANSVNIKGNNLKSNILEGQNISLAI
ncbi:filamentous hemagglutinin N-terminal domain-containing protein, partial [Pseudoleptotrichia goodfellowii]